MTLRIGVDAWPLAPQPTGIGRYVRELCEALAPRMRDAEFILYSPRAIEFPARPGWTLRVEEPAVRLPGPAWLKAVLPAACARDAPDVFWATRTLAPRLPHATALVATVYDLNYRVVPGSMQPVNRWAHRLWFARDVRRADAVVTISQGTAQRLAQALGRRADAVATPAVSPSYRRPPPDAVAATLERHGIRAPYLLAVGTREPRKNLAALVEAHARLRARNAIPHALVLAGAAGWSASVEGGAGIHALGYVDERDLPALYAGADLFVLPSLYEGYGIPLLEARACGTRVLASDQPEMREAGGAQGTYVAPGVDGLCAGIERALATPRHGAEATPLPSWEASADVMERVLRETARARRR